MVNFIGYLVLLQTACGLLQSPSNETRNSRRRLPNYNAFIQPMHLSPHLSKSSLPNINTSCVSFPRNNAHFLSSKGVDASPSPAEFERQELRAQLNAMKKAGISSANLSTEKRMEIESYVKSVATKCTSPVRLNDLGVGDTIVGTWRLAFSTESAALTVLPKEARVFVKIYDGNGRGKLDYMLKFTEKVFGLRSLTAKSSFVVDTGPVNPGLVCFTYDEITSHLFGMSMPTGLFGLLKGRVNYIESVYFDHSYWIDRGYSPQGDEYFNVYFKEEEE